MVHDEQSEHIDYIDFKYVWNAHHQNEFINCLSSEEAKVKLLNFNCKMNDAKSQCDIDNCVLNLAEIIDNADEPSKQHIHTRKTVLD